MKDFTVIAEIGGTHIGSLERAIKLANLAKLSGADVLKTQKRNPRESVKKELWYKPHPNEIFSYGETYLEHRINLELPIEEHKELKEYCESINIDYSTSVWDITSVKEVISLNPKIIKIPSACNDNSLMLDILRHEYEGEVHVPLGMTTKKEREKLYQRLLDFGDRVVVYHCVSGYPVPFEQLHLLEILELVKIFDKIGLSNHGYGIAMEPVAYSLGARYFERHFIDDRMFKHTDAACSVEPQGLSKMIRDIKAVSKALTFKPEEIEKIEQEQRDKLRVS
jgi:N-acetylneuraminate synthase